MGGGNRIEQLLGLARINCAGVLRHQGYTLFQLCPIG